jgi:hypothetical protein
MVKQKFQDIVLVLKNSRKAWFFIGIGVIVVLFLAFYDTRPRRRLIPRAPEKTESKLVADESASDVVDAFKQEVELLRKDSVQLQKENEENKKVMDHFEQQVVAIFGKMLNRLTETEQKLDEALQRVDRVSTTQSPSGSTTVVTEELPTSDPTKLEPFGELEAPEPVPPPKKEPEKLAFIGAGDSVEVELIAGVNASTDGTPYPTLFRLVGDVIGPDGTALPLGEARLIGAAQGSLVDSRVLFRLNQLNINLPNGERKVYSVDGWIVGEDGVMGMAGVPVDPLGRVLAGMGLVGAIQGAGVGIQGANQTIRRDLLPGAGINGGGVGSSVVDVQDVGQFAAGSALQQSAEEWNRLIRDRVKDMVPVIKLYSGRRATAVFDKSLPIEGLYKLIAEGDSDYESND